MLDVSWIINEIIYIYICIYIINILYIFIWLYMELYYYRHYHILFYVFKFKPVLCIKYVLTIYCSKTIFLWFFSAWFFYPHNFKFGSVSNEYCRNYHIPFMYLLKHKFKSVLRIKSFLIYNSFIFDENGTTHTKITN